jgi:hypothetical protein
MAATLGVLAASQAAAQGLSPLSRSGLTPSDRKAFHIAAHNPYPRPMDFELHVLDPETGAPASGARVVPDAVRLGPNGGRRVTLMFTVPPTGEERTVVLCIQPSDFPGPFLPRVCGRYAGRRP